MAIIESYITEDACKNKRALSKSEMIKILDNHGYLNCEQIIQIVNKNADVIEIDFVESDIKFTLLEHYGFTCKQINPTPAENRNFDGSKLSWIHGDEVGQDGSDSYSKMVIIHNNKLNK